MDKRMQLAMLIVAIIMGLNLFMTSRVQRQRAALRAHADSLAQAQAPATAAPPPPSGDLPPSRGPAPTLAGSAGGSMLFPASTGREADLVIETPRQRIRISPSGATLKEITLDQFKVGKEGRVNLVPPEFASQPDKHTLGVTLHSPSGELDLSRALFQPEPGSWPADGNTLKLAAGAPPYTLRLRTVTPGGAAVVKIFTIDPNRYDFQMALQVDRRAELEKVDSYVIDWNTGMPITEQAKEDEMAFKVSALVNDNLVRKGMRQFGRRSTGPETLAGTVHWATMQSKYFMVALIPEPAQNGTVLLAGSSDKHWMGMRFTQPTPWRSGPDTYRIYAGPIVFKDIQALGVGLESEVELGWKLVRPISGLMLQFMHFLHRFISNYGVIILVLSALIKLLFWPLTEKSFRSMRSMQELQPRMEELRRRYKDNPQEMNQQVMALYKERKVNPVGGCMPLLIQTPMFVALYSVLRSSIELRNAPFIGWIDNLAAPDVLFRLPMSLPVIGNNISLLPLLMGGAMIWQSKLGATTGPATGPAAQQQMLMKWMMPILFTFFFYKMPSGLVLYWLVNTLMSVWQQVHINRKLGPVAAVRTMPPEIEGRPNRGAPDRDDRPERGRSTAASPKRVGGKSS